MVTLKDPIELFGNNNAGQVVSYTCADGVNIPINTLLKFANPRTASASTGTGDLFAGVASSEKVADDGETNIGAYTQGVFDFAASGAISTGDTLITASPGNYVMASGAVTDPAKVVGYALDDSSDGRVSVRVNQ